MIEKEFLDRLPHPNTFNRRQKLLEVYNHDGVRGFRIFHKYKRTNNDGTIEFYWDNPIM